MRESKPASQQASKPGSPSEPGLPATGGSPAYLAMKLQSEVDWLVKRVYGAGAHVTLAREGSNKQPGTARWRVTVWRRLGGGYVWRKSGCERIDALEATKRSLEFLVRNEARCSHCHRKLPLAYGGDKPCTARPKMGQISLSCVP